MLISICIDSIFSFYFILMESYIICSFVFSFFQLASPIMTGIDNSYCCTIINCVINQFVLSILSLNGHLDSFQFCATTNNTAMSLLSRVF